MILLKKNLKIINNIVKNRTEFENTIKTLLFQQNTALLEKLDFDDDEVFLEPLLFAYFTGTKENLFPLF